QIDLVLRRLGIDPGGNPIADVHRLDPLFERDDTIASATMHVLAANLQKMTLVFFQYQTGQTAGRIGGSINSDSIGTNLGRDRRGVTVYDKFSVLSLTGQEWLSDIEKIIAVLAIEWHTRSYSSMGEKVIADDC